MDRVSLHYVYLEKIVRSNIEKVDSMKSHHSNLPVKNECIQVEVCLIDFEKCICIELASELSHIFIFSTVLVSSTHNFHCCDTAIAMYAPAEE